MKGKPTSHIMKGLIIVTILIVLYIVLQRTNTSNSFMKVLPTLLLAISVVISCLLFAKQMDGRVKFMEIFRHGFKTTAVITFFLVIYFFVDIKYVAPPVSQQEIEAAAKALQQQGNLMPIEAHDRAVEASKKIWMLVISGTIFVSIISGAVGSVLGSFLAKKNPVISTP